MASKSVKHKNKSVGFDIILYVFMIIFCLSTLYPFIYLLTVSLSATDVPLNTLQIIPTKISYESYIKVFSNDLILIGFRNSVIRLVVGCALTMLVTVLIAYPLSKRYLPHRTFWTALVVFTMYFSGGLIPSYLLMKQLGLVNNFWILILPNLVNTFHMIIARNFFMAIPDSLEESARIDGAGELKILFSLIIPISMPILATLFMWTAVFHWNAWFDALIYIRDPKMQVLQTITRRIVLDGMMDTTMDNYVNPNSLKAATTLVTVLPIICIYPFVQKYFVKGVMVGSLKG